MINETTYSIYFSSTWNEILPGSDRYVRMINSGLLERIEPPLEIKDDPNRRALVNVVAFQLYRYLFGQKKYFHDVNKVTDEEINKIKKNATLSLPEHIRGESSDEEFSRSEIIVIQHQCKSLLKNFSNDGKVFIDPEFRGCGIINTCRGDIIENHTLWEIKAGERNIKGIDLRQLLIYIALDFATENLYQLNRIGIFNPRMGIKWSETIDNVAKSLSGQSSTELLHDIIDKISVVYGP